MLRTTACAISFVLLGCTAGPSATPTRFEPTSEPVASTLDEALRQGYKVVDQDGRVVYCRESMKLGSHVRKERTCMTEQEFAEMRADSQRKAETLKDYRIPPPVQPPGSPGR